MSNLMDFLKSSIGAEETTQKVEDKSVIESEVEENGEENENVKTGINEAEHIEKNKETTKNQEVSNKEKESKEIDLFSALGVEAPGIAARVIFKYGNKEEEIKDLNITFEDLRKSKVEDFLELEDRDKVTWNVNYLIFKTVKDPEKKSISKIKSEIEEDKDFKNALKKNKKPLVMEIKPSIRAKTKG